MRKIFLTVLLVAFASAAFAEGTPKKPSVAGFVSNGFWDNWEVSAGFGTGTAFSNGDNYGPRSDRFGFEGNLSVTKWLHPVFGMRAQLQGGWFNNFDSQIGKMTWPYMFGHVDFMVNASNWIGGYRADRAWYAVPFAGFGYMASNFTDRSQRENASGSRQDFAFTAGLLSKFRLSPAFDFNIELKGLLTESDICPAKPDCPPAATMTRRQASCISASPRAILGPRPSPPLPAWAASCPRPATRTALNSKQMGNCASARPVLPSVAACWPAPRRRPTPCPRPGKTARWTQAGCPDLTVGTCSRPSCLSPSGARRRAAVTDAGLQ